MIPWLAHRDQPLPPTSRALGPASEAPGLLAAGGEITRERLVEAYSRGVFPWYSQGQPVLWWSPDPRMVLPVEEFRLSASLRKTLRRFARTSGLRGTHRHGDAARDAGLRRTPLAMARRAPGSCPR